MKNPKIHDTIWFILLNDLQYNFNFQDNGYGSYTPDT